MSGQVRDPARAVGRIDRTVLALSVGGVLAVGEENPSATGVQDPGDAR